MELCSQSHTQIQIQMHTPIFQPFWRLTDLQQQQKNCNDPSAYIISMTVELRKMGQLWYIFQQNFHPSISVCPAIHTYFHQIVSSTFWAIFRHANIKDYPDSLIKALKQHIRVKAQQLLLLCTFFVLLVSFVLLFIIQIGIWFYQLESRFHISPFHCHSVHKLRSCDARAPLPSQPIRYDTIWNVINGNRPNLQ